MTPDPKDELDLDALFALEALEDDAAEPEASVALGAPAENPLAALEPLLEEARGFATKARAENTRLAYEGDWRRFQAWCGGNHLSAMPAEPETVALYLTQLAVDGRKTSTIERALAAVVFRHAQHALRIDRRHPAIHDVLAGIRRELGRKAAKKTPVDDDILRQLVAATPVGWRGLRDRALLLVGWFSACRRAELAALQVHDVAFVDKGLLLTIRFSKTDQEGQGDEVAVPYAGDPALCPVRTLKTYLETLGIADGAVFRDVRAGVVREAIVPAGVGRIVKRLCRDAGLPEAEFGAHSLRAGFATTAYNRGKSLQAIMKQGRWRTEHVARAYIRHATAFQDNAAAGLL